jgi:hypothetical protein
VGYVLKDRCTEHQDQTKMYPYCSGYCIPQPTPWCDYYKSRLQETKDLNVRGRYFAGYVKTKSGTFLTGVS